MKRKTSSSVVQSEHAQQPTERTSTLTVLEHRVEELGQMRELAEATQQLLHMNLTDPRVLPLTASTPRLEETAFIKEHSEDQRLSPEHQTANGSHDESSH